MLSQRQSVYNACVEVGFTGEGKFEPTKDQRQNIIAIVTAGIMAGQVEFSADAKSKYDTEAKVRGYVSGMVSNWLRKDINLNGGDKYVTKNPGSRTGSGDEVLKNLKALKTKLTNDGAEQFQLDEVQKHIDARLETLKASKQKTVEINIDAIPEELRHLVASNG